MVFGRTGPSPGGFLLRPKKIPMDQHIQMAKSFKTPQKVGQMIFFCGKWMLPLTTFFFPDFFSPRPAAFSMAFVVTKW